jgi:hypothetical protein
MRGRDGRNLRPPEGKVPQESLALFDQAIHETSLKLNAMGDRQAYAEMQMAVGTGLDTKSLFQI